MKKRITLLVSVLMLVIAAICLITDDKISDDDLPVEQSADVGIKEPVDVETEQTTDMESEELADVEIEQSTDAESEEPADEKEEQSADVETEEATDAEENQPTNVEIAEPADENQEKPFEQETDKTVESDERIEDAIEDGFPRIVVSNVEAKPGDTVLVKATLINNPGVLGMSMTLSYDESALELLSVQNGEAFAEVLTMSNSKDLNSGCVFLWDGEEVLTEQILDGSILTLEFKIAEDAPLGKLPITMNCNEGGTVDNNLQTVDIAVENGFIKIKE